MIRTSIHINRYPSNYVEEEMPHVIVEVQYKGDLTGNFDIARQNQREANEVAKKIEDFIKTL